MASLICSVPKPPLVASSVTSDTSAPHFMCVYISCGDLFIYIFTNGEKEIILINLLIQIRDYSVVFREKSCFLRECQCLIMYNKASVTPFLHLHTILNLTFLICINELQDNYAQSGAKKLLNKNFNLQQGSDCMCLANQTTVLVLIKQFVILKQTTNVSKFTVEVSL